MEDPAAKRKYTEIKPEDVRPKWCNKCGRPRTPFDLWFCQTCHYAYCIYCIVFVDGKPLCEACEEGNFEVIH